MTYREPNIYSGECMQCGAIFDTVGWPSNLCPACAWDGPEDAEDLDDSKMEAKIEEEK